MSEKSIEQQLEIAFGQGKDGNFTIVKRKDVKYPLYHISTDKNVKEFTPRFSTRLLPNETRAIVRTSTAPDVVGCVIGHVVEPTTWDGDPNVYFIYDMEWDYAVIPDKKYLADVTWTREHWLLPFDLKHRVYKGDVIGMFFVDGHTTVYLKDGRLISWRYLVEVKEPVTWCDGTILEKGKWLIEMNMGKVMTKFKPNVGKNVFIHPADNDYFNRRMEEMFEKKSIRY